MDQNTTLNPDTVYIDCKNLPNYKDKQKTFEAMTKIFSEAMKQAPNIVVIKK